MAQKDILLTTDGDLDIANNDIQLTEIGGESIAQKVRIRLLTFFKEWVLNTEAGTRWFEKNKKKGTTEYSTNQEIRKRVLDTEGVRGVENYKSDFNEVARTFSCSFNIVTNEDEIIPFTLNNVGV